MENASQALLMAGGILLALLTISLFIIMFGNLATLQNERADTAEIKRIAEWNMQWEVYNKQYLYGSDVLTVINKAISEKEYAVEVIVDGSTVIKDWNIERQDIINAIKEYSKTKIYSCVAIKRDDINGRIRLIEFKLNDL